MLGCNERTMGRTSKLGQHGESQSHWTSIGNAGQPSDKPGNEASSNTGHIQGNDAWEYCSLVRRLSIPPNFTVENQQVKNLGRNGKRLLQ